MHEKAQTKIKDTIREILITPQSLLLVVQVILIFHYMKF